MIKSYLKLARSFNVGLTAIAPVLGALAGGEIKLLPLIFFFFVGFFGHSYGFALNDIFDYNVDKLSKELVERPLIKGELTIKKAWIFTIVALILSIVIAIYVSSLYKNYISLTLLFISAISITIYDLISKKYPAMDIFVALGILFLILYGSFTVAGKINMLSYFVATLGTLQVLFMQFIAGGLKDAYHDFKANAKTLAIKIGVRVNENKKMHIPANFKILAYSLQATYLFFLFYPFYAFEGFKGKYIQIAILLLLSTIMLFVCYRLISMKIFERNTARKYIGLHYYINFSLVPIMLSCLNPWIVIIAFIPPLAFIFSNITIHGSILPKTM